VQQKPMSLIDFQRNFATKNACQEHLSHLRWPEGSQCPQCYHQSAYLHRSRHLYQCKAQLSGLPHRRDYLPQDENAFEEVVLDDLPNGTAEERHLHAICITHVEHQKLQNGVGDGS